MNKNISKLLSLSLSLSKMFGLESETDNIFHINEEAQGWRGEGVKIMPQFLLQFTFHRIPQFAIANSVPRLSSLINFPTSSLFKVTGEF